ncbi:hypothetical protein LTR27_008776 [Elasticomyces elasticus]|nr:hypothetical protein LTR27_008776 [Elasticomyces elasticus]
MANWGLAGINTIVTKLHASPHPAIDPSNIHLPKPFIVCIVGASRGIGAGVATSYAKAGATGIILASRRISGLEETAAACREINPNVEIEIVACDITSSVSVAELAEKTKKRFNGRLDVVVVNSGFSGPIKLKITETDPETFQNAINVNYVGTFLCAKYLIPLLLATTNGAKSFVAVSSMAALIIRGPIANAQYTVSKAAQLRLMECIHEQYYEEGLSALSVHPGAVASEMVLESAPGFREFLTDSADLCGAFCVWATGDEERKRWMSGRLVSAKWDVEELEGRKGEMVAGDLLKLRLAVPDAVAR